MIEITEQAKKHILLAMEEEDRDDLGVRVEIVGRRGPGGFQYKMDLIGPDEKEDGDIVVENEAFTIYIDGPSAPDLEGASIDFVQKLNEAGFKFENPNSAWKDPLAARVQEVIDDQINPQIASHGGFVTLLDVKESNVYLSMGGGCQGCGMADVTLKQGIETMIREAVPEVSAIYDTTDHAAGQNPYFAG
jgi:Fe/S biogenesis protein NfuA